MTLKRMKRRHLRQDIINVCKKARRLRPNIVFGADIIAGFPTETDEMFAATLRLVEECDLTFLHVFPIHRVREHLPQKCRRCRLMYGKRGRRSFGIWVICRWRGFYIALSGGE